MTRSNRSQLVLLLSVPLALGLLVTGCAEGERGCIERVLLEDARASQAGNPAAVVSRMRAIETSACPDDFRDAYVTHVQAWDKRSRLVPAARAVGRPIDGFWDGVGKFAGAVVVGIAEAQASEEITQTFRQVERVAVRHRATLAH